VTTKSLLHRRIKRKPRLLVLMELSRSRECLLGCEMHRLLFRYAHEKKLNELKETQREAQQKIRSAQRIRLLQEPVEDGRFEETDRIAVEK
uniref:Uncharacterized protein n=1 Tax=Solanum lycopersicum TaxID=4081 RepID=A0A3Q7EBH7_SOLLC